MRQSCARFPLGMLVRLGRRRETPGQILAKLGWGEGHDRGQLTTRQACPKA
jgi:hypothetical protein